MKTPLYTVLLGAAGLASALPTSVHHRRAVPSLNQAATEEAQQRDGTATRAFSNTQIKTSDGRCLFVDELSGDFRANLTPIQVAGCNNSKGQQWDVITSGKHNNVPGQMLVVSALTQACLNFDPRRAGGNQVLLFSCGGRADGGGQVTDSQLFAFGGGAGPLSLTPKNSAGSCLTVKGNVVDVANCNKGDPNQSFTFGNGGNGAAPAPGKAAPPPPPPAAATTATTTAAAPATTNPTSGVIPVSRAGGVLNPAAVAESHQRDNTATRAFSSVSLKSANGQCLFIDPTAGDFRENLIPIVLKPCDNSPNQKFDFITAGKHNNQPDASLVVSSLTQGCLNFDERRAAGDTVILFSCGGRADGGGAVTDSQVFAFKAGEKSLRLQPKNARGAVCLVPNAAGRLDQAPCSQDPGQLFTIV
ncbi:hypothetical protein HK104_000673 [Borealophlyctis nickersoniae]|nr:hypothetical protein HK104_000673 [Borealophlyctis nickersoniae]